MISPPKKKRVPISAKKFCYSMLLDCWPPALTYSNIIQAEPLRTHSTIKDLNIFVSFKSRTLLQLPWLNYKFGELFQSTEEQHIFFHFIVAAHQIISNLKLHGTPSRNRNYLQNCFWWLSGVGSNHQIKKCPKNLVRDQMRLIKERKK